MTIYLTVLLSSVVLGILLETHKSNVRKIIYLIVEFGIIILISSLRSYMVGIDLRDHYYRAFIIYSKTSLQYFMQNSPYDKGYILFYSFIYKFTTNPQWMIAIHSFIVYALIARFIYKNSDDIVMSTYLFIAFNSWFMYMTMLRQSLAVVMVLLAIEIFSWKKIKKSRYVLYILLILLASAFHSSAILMLIYPIFSQIKVNKKNCLIFALEIIIMFLSLNYIFTLMANVISFTKDYSSAYENDIGILNFTSLYSIAVGALTLFIAYLFLYKRKSEFAKNGQNTITNDQLVYLVLIYTAIKILRLKLGIVSRFAEYFNPFIWILIPRALENIKRKNTRIVFKMATYVLFFVAFAVCGYTNGASLYGTVPFKFFWR